MTIKMTVISLIKESKSMRRVECLKSSALTSIMLLNVVTISNLFSQKCSESEDTMMLVQYFANIVLRTVIDEDLIIIIHVHDMIAIKKIYSSISSLFNIAASSSANEAASA